MADGHLSALNLVVFLTAGALILGVRIPRPVLWIVSVLGLLGFARLVATMNWITGDAEAFWRAGVLAREGRNPYVGGNILVLNPPPGLAWYVVFSLLPLPIYLVLWRVLAVISFGATAFASTASLGEETGERPWRLSIEALMLLTAAFLSSVSVHHAMGSMVSAFITISCILGALVCRARSKPVGAGILLALGMLKVTTLLPFLLLFCRKKDVKTWIAFAVSGLLLTFVAVSPVGLPAAIEKNLSVIRESGSPGRINDYSFENKENVGLITLDYAVYHLGVRDRGIVRLLQGAITVALGVWIAWRLLRRPGLAHAPACAIVACFSALFLYHRLYDMGILVIPLVYCTGRGLREPGRLRWAYRFCAAAILWVLYLRMSRIGPLVPMAQQAGLTARLIEVIVLPQAIWAILSALVVLLIVEQRAAVAPAGVPGGQAHPVEVAIADPNSLPTCAGYSVTIIVPTYKEADSLPLLLGRIDDLRNRLRLDCEVLIMDDDSRDGTAEWIASKGLLWVRLVVRTTNRGLSPAVVDGLKLAAKDFVVVMDADLSHPPERIPDMIRALERGSEFVIGSRYVAGASTDESWGVLRWINSKVATLMARPFTRLADPMSGFFAFRRGLLDRADSLNPIGYKIGLELLVKCGVTKASEVPIHFAQRQKGESKLTLKEQLRYIQHLRRLLLYRYPNWSSFLQFAVVGASGVLVNLLVLTLLLLLKVPMRIAVASAIGVSMLTNFALNRRFTFSYARSGGVLRQLAGFVGACSLGALLNYGTTMFMATKWPGLVPQAAALLGIIGGTALNFVICRIWVFKSARPTDPPIPPPLGRGAG